VVCAGFSRQGRKPRPRLFLWEEALNAAGEAVRAFRSPVDRGKAYPFYKRYVTPEYSNLVRGNPLETEEEGWGPARGAWLGLPMTISSNDQSWGVNVVGVDRRPAPISIRIVPSVSGGGGAKILVQGFFDTYLPEDVVPTLGAISLPAVKPEEIAVWHRSIMASFLAGRPKQGADNRAKRST
jgi:hypothetical protein